MPTILQKKIRKYKAIIQNTGYLSFVEILQLFMPFIALPYIIRVIGVENYGTIAFAQTIISYFIIFINFGLDISAAKNVSIYRENKEKLSQVISSVLSIKVILLLISSIVFFPSLLTVPYLYNHRILFSFSFLLCFSELLYPVWFYQGIEKMQYVAIIRVIGIVLYTLMVFLVIKKETDYIYIPLLQSLTNLVAGIVSFYVLLKIKSLSLFLPPLKIIKEYYYESIPFFISRLSVVINQGLAKIASGLFLSMHAVAVFDLAQKIARVSTTPMQMLNAAVYPHIAKTKDEIFASRFFLFNACLSFLVALTVFFIAPFFIKLFLGDTMLEVIGVLRILCLFVFFAGITIYIGSPVLVSFGYSKSFNYSVILSTIVLIISYGVLYISNSFSVYNFAIVAGFVELIILVYRLYCCFYYKIFSLKRIFWKYTK